LWLIETSFPSISQQQKSLSWTSVKYEEPTAYASRSVGSDFHGKCVSCSICKMNMQDYSMHNKQTHGATATLQ